MYFVENNSPLVPNHPRKGLIRGGVYSTKTTSDSPASITSSFSDHDIKRDTSLNITHVYEEIEPQSVTTSTTTSGLLRSKVKEVLHSNKNNILNNNNKHEEIVIPIDDDDVEERESLFTDRSEEITDSDSDSDFVPSKSGSSDSIQIIEDEEIESIAKRRTRKTPQRFSPNQPQQKKKRLKTDKKRPSSCLTRPVTPKTLNMTPSTQQQLHVQKNTFTHDKCAAWDCVKLSGSIKQITWVACDDCDAWYHVTCSGLTAKDAMKPDTKYHCGCA